MPQEVLVLKAKKEILEGLDSQAVLDKMDLLAKEESMDSLA